MHGYPTHVRISRWNGGDPFGVQALNAEYALNEHLYSCNGVYGLESSGLG